MIKYRLHNITNFGIEIHDFYTENSLNNYIALFVDTPYWVENLYTNKNIYVGFDGEAYTIDTKGNKDYIETFRHHKIESDNDSRETPLFRTRKPAGSWPFSASATPMTAHSATSGWLAQTSSIAPVDNR